MLKKKHHVVHVKSLAGTHKILTGIYIAALVITSIPFMRRTDNSYASGCPDLRVVFSRGSGGTHNSDANYLEYKSTIENKLKTTTLSYEFVDLDYPAVGVGIDNLDTTIGAYVGSGEAYEFGKSVNAGVKNLTKLVNNECPNTRYIIGGYSQGAMVISKALKNLNADKVIYVATFGDPKIYLPEGKGIKPLACSGKNLSDYRMYVPDCRAYKGLLGAYIPYRPDSMASKVGTWCNKRDIFCSSYLSIKDHVSYISDNLYEDASRVIFDKIAKHFGFENTLTSPHDTAILIDSTKSMNKLVDKYKKEALNLAEQTLNAGGRIALYDYRDLYYGYTPVEHCNFSTCTLELFKSELNKIKFSGGGDAPESLLSASLHVMKSLKWNFGSTKSLVILTDAGYHSPDRDGTTFYDVKKLSKEIDPVNFYIITEPENVAEYQSLADATDGKVVSSGDDLTILTTEIMERYDSLPRVEEEFTDVFFNLPTLEIMNAEKTLNSEAKITFKTNDSTKTLVFLNDSLLGATTEDSVTITNLRNDAENTVTLVPLSESRKGEPVVVTLGGPNKIIVPKAPNTGQR